MRRISLDGIGTKIDVGFASILGTREEQQDALLLDAKDGCLLAAVCDGMGGLHNGQQASLMAVDTLRTLHQEKKDYENYGKFLLGAVDILDESVFGLRGSGSGRGASGTTITAAAIADNYLYWLSVGDSRLYLIRNDEIVCVTTDHNYNLLLDQAYQDRTITELMYQTEKKRGEALISYVGMGGIDLMDINDKPFVLLPGDLILLMSDGLYRCLSKDEMLRIAKSGKNAEEIVIQLTKRSEANAVGQQDNTSIIVIKMNGASIL